MEDEAKNGKRGLYTVSEEHSNLKICLPFNVVFGTCALSAVYFVLGIKKPPAEASGHYRKLSSFAAHPFKDALFFSTSFFFELANPRSSLFRAHIFDFVGNYYPVINKNSFICHSNHLFKIYGIYFFKFLKRFNPGFIFCYSFIKKIR